MADSEKFPQIFQSAYYKKYKGQLKNEIAEEFKRHRYVLQSGTIDGDEKEIFKEIASRKAEYDVPLENAYFRDFYDKMADFICSLPESALKINDSLQFADITGCLRISRESIFTGLNNLKINYFIITHITSGNKNEERLSNIMGGTVIEVESTVTVSFLSLLYQKRELLLPAL